MKKLTAYSALAGGFLLSGLQADAQIVYTDVEPDETIGVGDSYELDLNDDGTTDFELIINSFTIADAFYSIANPSVMWDGLINRVLIYPDGGNSVNASTVTATTGNTFAYPYAMNNGNSVDEDLNFKDNSYQFMGFYISIIDYPSVGNVFPYNNFGKWPNKNDKFLGLRFEDGGQTYYGWVRMSLDELELTINDYAYNATPDTPLETGVTVSINNQIPADKIHAYSFGNTVNIITNNLQAETATVKIVNALGEVVFADNLNLAGMKIILDQPATGVYTLQITADGAVYNKQVFINQ